MCISTEESFGTAISPCEWLAAFCTRLQSASEDVGSGSSRVATFQSAAVQSHAPLKLVQRHSPKVDHHSIRTSWQPEPIKLDLSKQIWHSLFCILVESKEQCSISRPPDLLNWSKTTPKCAAWRADSILPNLPSFHELRVWCAEQLRPVLRRHFSTFQFILAAPVAPWPVKAAKKQ